MFRIILLALAVLIIALLPLYEKKLNGFFELVRGKMPKPGETRENQNDLFNDRSRSDGCKSEITGDKTPLTEEDILDNKSKWRMLIIGYCIFILFMIFAAISIVTLNTKLNNLSAATGDIVDRLTVLENK